MLLDTFYLAVRSRARKGEGYRSTTVFRPRVGPAHPADSPSSKGVGRFDKVDNKQSEQETRSSVAATDWLVPVNDSTLVSGQIKSRERVRDLAEVYTHEREVNAMLDLVPDMFPSEADPANTDRKFLEPTCGHGNFLEEILRRKLAFVTTERYGRGARQEHRILRCLASIYAIDICEENVEESRRRLRRVIASHCGQGRIDGTEGLWSAVDTILMTNVVRADALEHAAEIEMVDYQAGPRATFIRLWSHPLAPEPPELDLFSATIEPRRDAVPVHYSHLANSPDPIEASAAGALEVV